MTRPQICEVVEEQWRVEEKGGHLKSIVLIPT